MRKFINLVKIYAIPVLSLGLPALALAQIPQPPVTAPISNINNITAIEGPTGILCSVINWLFYLLIIAAVVFVLLAAFKYLTAAGEPEKVKRQATPCFTRSSQSLSPFWRKRFRRSQEVLLVRRTSRSRVDVKITVSILRRLRFLKGGAACV